MINRLLPTWWRNTTISLSYLTGSELTIVSIQKISTKKTWEMIFSRICNSMTWKNFSKCLKMIATQSPIVLPYKANQREESARRSSINSRIFRVTKAHWNSMEATPIVKKTTYLIRIPNASSLMMMTTCNSSTWTSLGRGIHMTTTKTMKNHILLITTITNHVTHSSNCCLHINTRPRRSHGNVWRKWHHFILSINFQ